MTRYSSDYLEDLCFQIVSRLADTEQPMGSADLAEALKVKHDVVQAAVCKLIVRDRIVSVGRGVDKRPIYALRIPTVEQN